jgi:hypothetical protein
MGFVRRKLRSFGISNHFPAASLKYLIVFSLSISFAGKSFAETGISPLIAMASVAEIGLPSTSEVVSQGNFPYCQLHALSTFLELWANRTPSKIALRIDPAYFALVYNAEVSDGQDGTRTAYLLPLVQKYGALPVGAVIESALKLAWPMADWQTSHKTLMGLDELTPRLSAWYYWQDRWIKPRDFFDREIGINFSQFTLVFSKNSESYKPRAAAGSIPVSALRQSKESLNRRLAEVAAEVGWDQSTLAKRVVRNPNAVFTLLAVQLFESYPAMLAINPAMVVTKYFQNYKVIDKVDLLAVGQANDSSHAVVAVAYCETDQATSPLCKKFAADMAAKGTEECLVVQNSWGAGSNADGYACLSRAAFSRMYQWSYLRDEILAKK